ncbi:MAG: pyridoxal 5'-phosphate synthase glutaminase subunit PdxT, partial [Chloroflexota bacterium]|nr:pyridoxal 5'-phosphate synthase glutaminase subunit PdxT [Chloroflexota bacterium]
IHAIFIRAPVVTDVGPEVEIIAKVEDGKPVAVTQGKLMATSFHPELTSDTRMHELFCRLSSS